MKQSKDPFEAAYEEQDESPPESPIGQEGSEAQTGVVGGIAHGQEDDEDTGGARRPNAPKSTPMAIASTSTKNKEDYDEEEEENVEVELSKFPSSADPTKVARMQSILSQFTDEQMSRYESFRRSALQKSHMRRLLVSITGSQKISLPMTIAVCGIAKMFVGELVETARVVVTERKESGPIRPCHIREAYRRLKLDGKVPKRSVPRLFR